MTQIEISEQILILNYRQLVDTTVEIANRVGASEIINRLVDDLKDENEQYRKMVRQLWPVVVTSWHNMIMIHVSL